MGRKKGARAPGQFSEFSELDGSTLGRQELSEGSSLAMRSYLASFRARLSRPSEDLVDGITGPYHGMAEIHKKRMPPPSPPPSPPFRQGGLDPSFLKGR